MLVMNELNLFIAATSFAEETDNGYTLVSFGLKIRQKWAGRAGFV